MTNGSEEEESGSVESKAKSDSESEDGETSDSSGDEEDCQKFALAPSTYEVEEKTGEVEGNIDEAEEKKNEVVEEVASGIVANADGAAASVGSQAAVRPLPPAIPVPPTPRGPRPRRRIPPEDVPSPPLVRPEDPGGGGDEEHSPPPPRRLHTRRVEERVADEVCKERRRRGDEVDKKPCGWTASEGEEEVLLERHIVYGLQQCNLLVHNIIHIYTQQQREDRGQGSGKGQGTTGPGRRAGGRCRGSEGGEGRAGYRGPRWPQGCGVARSKRRKSVNMDCYSSSSCRTLSCSLCEEFGSQRHCQVALLGVVYEQHEGDSFGINAKPAIPRVAKASPNSLLRTFLQRDRVEMARRAQESRDRIEAQRLRSLTQRRWHGQCTSVGLVCLAGQSPGHRLTQCSRGSGQHVDSRAQLTRRGLYPGKHAS
ncbi:unnamed protein product [Lampetra fluviatilis]